MALFTFPIFHGTVYLLTLVALLAEAVEKLSGRGQAHFRVGGDTSHTLWHGVAGMHLSYEFLVRGGTSMGLLSASPSRQVCPGTN